MKIYNTLTRKKEELIPIEPGHIKMYVCGITAYDSCHIGHARAAVAFDMVVRYLRYKGYKVTFAKNYTDIDDKIINRANKEGRDWKELTEFYINEYAEDMAGLGNLKPDIEPRATDHIKEMIATIQKLFDNGLAYKTNSGVYFSVRKFKGYGRLSGKNIEELESGARVEVDEEKADPLDFALWKISKPSEPFFPSPWGNGRPGWHIECSAMSSKYLGQPFDIHGGGRDLIFPHHENEIAQAEGAENRKFVKYWLHNGFVNINSEKMSKSLGNILTISKTLKVHNFEVVRYFLLSSHYRSPIDYTNTAISEAAQAVDRFYEMMGRIMIIPPIPPLKKGGKGGFKAGKLSTKIEKELYKNLNTMESRITEFMDNDFNTAGAMGVIFDLVRQTNKYLDSVCHPERSEGSPAFNAWLSAKWAEAQKTFQQIFGVFASDPKEYETRRKKTAASSKGVDTKLVEQLIADRKTARTSRDFAKADIIKKQLTDMGIELKDKPDGTTEWMIRKISKHELENPIDKDNPLCYTFGEGGKYVAIRKGQKNI